MRASPVAARTRTRDMDELSQAIHDHPASAEFSPEMHDRLAEALDTHWPRCPDGSRNFRNFHEALQVSLGKREWNAVVSHVKSLDRALAVAGHPEAPHMEALVTAACEAGRRTSLFDALLRVIPDQVGSFPRGRALRQRLWGCRYPVPQQVVDAYFLGARIDSDREFWLQALAWGYTPSVSVIKGIAARFEWAEPVIPAVEAAHLASAMRRQRPAHAATRATPLGGL